MCLDNISERLVAENDITVWKRIDKTLERHIIHVECHGKRFEVEIGNTNVKGTLSVNENGLYFCHDNINFNGSPCPEKFGHTYSWCLDPSVKIDSLKMDGESVELGKGVGYETPYQGFPIKLGKEYMSDIEIINNPLTGHKIHQAIHSFVRKEDAISDGGLSTYVYVVECVIPKGSVYYVGDFYNTGDSIASDTIIYGDVVEEVYVIMKT